MRLHQRVRREGAWIELGPEDVAHAQLALVFSSADILRKQATWDELRAFYPAARIIGCSTAGEIVGTSVHDESIVCTGIHFEHSRIAVSCVGLNEADSGIALGALLISRLPREELTHVIVFADGLQVNGSSLVEGMSANLAEHVTVTGGLAADGAMFKSTAVCVDRPAPSQQLVAIGLYGSKLRIGCGSLGGWDPFGPERLITKSEGSTLYELDGQPALDLYKRYLGVHTAELPASGLLFPLAVRGNTTDVPVVRTILSVDEQRRTLTFAGDLPVGHRARLMKANFERLIDGASNAAQKAQQGNGIVEPQLAILISCVGRKLVLKQRVEEEVEAVRSVLGARTVMTGFYSYGEISPSMLSARSQLHNQTMTITTVAEL